jgi:hypothetical protein
MSRHAVPGRAAATATLATQLGPAGRLFKVASCEYLPSADIVGAATNSLTLELRNRGQDGSLNVLLASLAMVAGVNASNRFAKPITLVTTNGAPTVLEGDLLEFHSVKIGAGLADPGGTVVLGETAI